MVFCQSSYPEALTELFFPFSYRHLARPASRPTLPRLRRSRQSRRSHLEEVAALGLVTESPLLLFGSSSRPLAGTLCRQDASNYDQRGRVEEHRGRSPFPAGRCPSPPPTACAHARGGLGGEEDALRGLRGASARQRALGAFTLSGGVLSQRLKNRDRDVTTWHSALSSLRGICWALSECLLN